MIKIFTDGSTRRNGAENAPGAWGFVALNGDEIIHKAAAGFRPATNQQAELQAVIEACKWASANYDTFTDIQIVSDSAYIINCYRDKWYVKWQSNGWTTSNKGTVKNIELWKQLIPFFDMANFNFVKVKGHAGDKYNCMIDEMVQEITETML